MATYRWLLLFLLPVHVSAQTFLRSMLKLPDTGQTSSYTSTPGEDSDYSIHPPGYMVNPDGTVTDTITGLMWQQTDGGEMTFNRAVQYCDTLTLGGFNNWRLPTPHESFSILHMQHVNPAIDPSFTTTQAEYWWTSALQANDTGKVWVTNAGGGIGNHPKTETISAGGNKKFHVRAVRQVQLPVTLPAHFNDQGNATITDLVTDLTWTKNISSDTLTWENALLYADTCTKGGFTDWRLPNIREIQSLNDESLVNPSISQTFFPAAGLKKIWSSTTLPNQTTKAWYLDTHFGITTYYAKIRRIYVLLVRGGDNVVTSAPENKSGKSWRVAPNPGKRSIRIVNDAPSQIFLIYKTDGSLFYSGNAGVIYDVPPGLYFVKQTGNPIVEKCVVTE